MTENNYIFVKNKLENICSFKTYHFTVNLKLIINRCSNHDQEVNRSGNHTYAYRYHFRVTDHVALPPPLFMVKPIGLAKG